jgi:hypothetical protein
VGLLRVDVNGLGVLAGNCEALAGELDGVVAPTATGSSYQATSAAANAVYGDVGVAGAALVARMRATAAKLTAASAAYASQDAGSAGDIEAAAESVEV